MMLTQTYLPQPEDVVSSFVRAWNDRNAYALANLFAEDAEFVNVVGLWWHSRQAIWRAHDYGLRIIFKDSVLEARRIKKRMITENVTLIHARFKLTGQTKHNDVHTPATRQNIFSFVLQKEEKGWICVSAHNTDIVSGKETNVVDEQGNLRAVDYRSSV